MQRAAQSGYAEAQFNMALICADGELVTKDPEQSFDWAKRAAEQGNGQAQRFLGACYEVGFGIVLFRRQHIPFESRCQILRDAQAVLVAAAPFAPVR